MEIKNVVLDCGEDCSFKLADGRKIKNLNELNECFADMSDEIFRCYVNDVWN